MNPCFAQIIINQIFERINHSYFVAANSFNHIIINNLQKTDRQRTGFMKNDYLCKL